MTAAPSLAWILPVCGPATVGLYEDSILVMESHLFVRRRGSRYACPLDIGVRSWECWLVGRSLLGFVPLRLLVDAVCARVTESPRLADGVIRVRWTSHSLSVPDSAGDAFVTPAIPV